MAWKWQSAKRTEGKRIPSGPVGKAVRTSVSPCLRCMSSGGKMNWRVAVFGSLEVQVGYSSIDSKIPYVWSVGSFSQWQVYEMFGGGGGLYYSGSPTLYCILVENFLGITGKLDTSFPSLWVRNNTHGSVGEPVSSLLAMLQFLAIYLYKLPTLQPEQSFNFGVKTFNGIRSICRPHFLYKKCLPRLRIWH